MNRKKLWTLAASLTLTAVIGAGATLAYFTDNADTENVITMGHVDVELTEPNFNGGTENTITGVMAGQTITKDPTITLAEGSLDALIRVKLEITGFEEFETEKGNQYVEDVIDGLNIDGTKWKKVGDYYYYASALSDETGKNTAVLFDEVVIPTTWNNAVADKTFQINVSVEAVQAENLADDFINTDGSWNITAEEILEYEAD